MNIIRDFIEWAGSQRRAAEILEISEAQMSRIASGGRSVTPSVALRAERASAGRFKKEAFVWPADNEAA